MKRRLADLLVERGLAPSAERARALVMAGRVFVGGRRAEKAGDRVEEDARIEVAPPARPFVSRGGGKLAAALDAFALSPRGKVCLDVGTATGGFTDCLLQRGAARVYAVDTGYGKIDERLRRDPRVVLRERCNARHLGAREVPEPVALAAIDVSFISAEAVLPAVASLLADGADVVVLVKPQFEAERGEVPRGGVVRDPEVRQRAVARIAAAASALGFRVAGVAESPVRGARGNVEFLLALRKG